MNTRGLLIVSCRTVCRSHYGPKKPDVFRPGRWSIEGRIVTTTDRWLKIAALQDEHLVSR